MGKSIVIIENMQTLSVGGHKILLTSEIRQYFEFNNCFVVRMEYNGLNEGNLLGFGYSDSNFSVVWRFNGHEVIGIQPEIPQHKKSSEFATHRHYENYCKQFSGKELLIVQAGDFAYRIDANNGEIYGKWETR